MAGELVAAVVASVDESGNASAQKGGTPSSNGYLSPRAMTRVAIGLAFSGPLSQRIARGPRPWPVPEWDRMSFREHRSPDLPRNSVARG